MSTDFRDIIPMVPRVRHILSHAVALRSIVGGSNLTVSPQVHSEVHSATMNTIRSEHRSVIIDKVYECYSSSVLSGPVA